MAALLAAGMLGSCSSDYLDVPPVTSISTSEVQNTQEGALYALQGMCQTMYCPVGDYFDYNFPNGEPYIAMVYGDVMGEDYFSLMWAQSTGSNYMWAANNIAGGWLTLQGWSYCYNLINQANTVLDGIDNIKGDEALLKYIKAATLTIRAHAYTRLLQIYAPRWKDSNNGERYCVVLREHAGIEDVPLAKMKDVLSFIYTDLETAETLFVESGLTRSENWEPNLNVAYGIHARAALLRDDWPTAQDKAKKAREGIPVMTADQYKAGFCEPNDEWIWSAHEEGSSLYFAAFGSMYACNGPYPGIWGLGAGAINYDLYRKFPEGDIRSDLFFTPDKLYGNQVQKTSFWNSKWIQPLTMDLNSVNALMKNQINVYQEEHIPNNPNITYREPYSNFQTKSNKDSYVVFGAQYKFWGKDTYGSGDFCIMRGAEMLLTEAEAAYHNQDMTTAVENLKTLNAQRNPNYTCNLSGEALLEEIRTQRRLELWGEGFNWFDLKRWNLPLERRPWVEKDRNSNNVPRAYALTKDPSDKGWVFAVPLSESRYNKLVDRTLVDF